MRARLIVGLVSAVFLFPELGIGASARSGERVWKPLDTMARNAPHPHAAALFYDFLLSDAGQRMIAKEGRAVANPKIEPIDPRMKELQALLSTRRVHLRTVEEAQLHYKDGLQILDDVILKQKR